MNWEKRISDLEKRVRRIEIIGYLILGTLLGTGAVQITSIVGAL